MKVKRIDLNFMDSIAGDWLLDSNGSVIRLLSYRVVRKKNLFNMAYSDKLVEVHTQTAGQRDNRTLSIHTNNLESVIRRLRMLPERTRAMKLGLLRIGKEITELKR